MRGDDGLRHAVFVLVIVGIELRARQNFAGAGGLNAGGVVGVADGSALDLLPVDELLKHDLVVLVQGDQHRLLQQGAVGCLGDAHAGTGVGGLDKDGVAQLCLDGVQHHGTVQL